MGATPIWRGSTPTMAVPTNLARTSYPSTCARARVVRIHNAAPSPTPLALPAVVDAPPHSGKEGFNAASPSALTFGRTVSSTDTMVPRSSMGRISSANTPSANACVTCFFLRQSPRCESLGNKGERKECETFAARV